MDPLIESLRTLIRQSSETFGADDPATLMLKQQLEAALAGKEKPAKVFWIQPAVPGDSGGEQG